MPISFCQFEGKPFAGRDAIIRSVCPQMYGLYIVKLALLCVMIGGVGQHDENEMKIRGESHFLMVGDPGTGKSQVRCSLFLFVCSQLHTCIYFSHVVA